jgi:hypothetical protein
MKRARILIATLVCAVMMMGVGYAAFTDSLKLNASLATGTMNVIYGTDTKVDRADSEVVATVTRSDDKKTLDCTIANLYPGRGAVFSIQVKNLSGVPVSYTNCIPTGLSEYEKSILDFDFARDDYNAEIPANGERTYKVFVRLSKDVDNTVQNKTYTFQLRFDWEQVIQDSVTKGLPIGSAS